MIRAKFGEYFQSSFHRDLQRMLRRDRQRIYLSILFSSRLSGAIDGAKKAKSFQSSFHRDSRTDCSIQRYRIYLSILFSSRFESHALDWYYWNHPFQSSFHRDLFHYILNIKPRVLTFNPLFIEIGLRVLRRSAERGHFQSSFHRDFGFEPIGSAVTGELSILFSSRYAAPEFLRFLNGFNFQSSFHRDPSDSSTKNVSGGVLSILFSSRYEFIAEISNTKIFFQSSFHRDTVLFLDCMACSYYLSILFSSRYMDS